ncbi:MAG: sensor histidine kinase [Myxococcaceae bacterium]
MKLGRPTFRTKLLASYLVLVAAVELVTGLALNWSVREDLIRDLDQRMESQARAAAVWLGRSRHPNKLAPRMGEILSVHVRILDAEGLVLGDSRRGEDMLPQLEPDGLTSEVLEALAGKVGRAVRYSAEEHEDVYYLAHVVEGDALAVRLSVSLKSINATVRGVRQRILVAAVLGFLAALALALLASRLVVRPLSAMMRSAAKVAGGDYQIEAPVEARDEFDQLAQSLRSMAVQLEARMNDLKRMEALRREFLADASHELRTPVSVIQGYVQTLIELKSEDTKARGYVEIVQRHALRLGTMLDDLLQLASLDSDYKERRSEEAIPVEPIATRVLRTTRDRAVAAQVTTTVEAPPELRVWANADYLEQALENLIENAIKYGRTGGTVTVRATQTAQGVSIAVRDDGGGIAAEHLPHLFDRFYRVDKSRSRELGGTGLGLAIVKRLTESMGGQVTVESREGEGTTFTLHLLAANEHGPVRPEAPTA